MIPDTADREADQAARSLQSARARFSRTASVRPLDLKVGDKILFGKYGGTEVKVDGDELLVMREEDVMAVIEK